MDSSVFMNKDQLPSSRDLEGALGDKHVLWMEIREAVLHKYPQGVEEWNFPGKKYGWSYRIKDKKRAIIYLLPGDKAFMAAFVFGEKAFHAILESDVSEQIKADLRNARVYAEGRGIRIPVANSSSLKDIFQLVDFKLAH